MNVGTKIAHRLFYALAGKTNLSAIELEKIVYGTCDEIADESDLNDWIEMPNGTTFTCTFKPIN